MEGGTLGFWLSSTGATHSLVTLAVLVMRASRAEGAESGSAALPAGAKPQSPAGLGPSALAVATGGHPAPGGWQTPLGPGLACREEEKLRLFPLSRLGSRTSVPGLPVPGKCHRWCKHRGMLSPPVCPSVGLQSRRGRWCGSTCAWAFICTPDFSPGPGNLGCPK